MKKSIGKIDIELNGLNYRISFNGPNYTYQYMTVDELENLWQELLEITHNHRRDEQVAKVSN